MDYRVEKVSEYAEGGEALALGSESVKLETGAGAGRFSDEIFVSEGFAAVSVNGEMLMVKAGEKFVAEYEAGEDVTISVMGEGKAVRTLVRHDGEAAAATAEAEEPVGARKSGGAQASGTETGKIVRGEAGQGVGPGAAAMPAAKAPITAADYKECVFIANTQWRFSKYLVKRLAKIWYDAPLQSAIDRINSFYVVDMVFLLGLALVALVLNRSFGAAGIIVGLVIWCILYFLVLSPCVYLFMCPRPIAEHIKDVDKLTPQEQEQREKQLARNPRLERLMKRYGMDESDGEHPGRRR